MTQHTLGHLKEVQAELKSRKIEALRLYEPMPLQQQMHASMASERIVLGHAASAADARQHGV
ncbi:hypothetical protein EBZ80_26645 [bacterium]|nr:hypothetical protein [bacterium]